MSKVLVADDEFAICEAFAEIVRREGHTPLIASNGAEAVTLARDEKPHVAFLDVQMPGMTGLQALRQIKANDPELPIILMTARGSVDIAMQAMEAGAFDYLGKPIDLPQIRTLLSRALEQKDKRHLKLTDEVINANTDHPIGKGPQMQHIFKMMGMLTNNEMTVLITGASGTGKELVAKGIHANGARGTRPFVAVNCAAIPEHLVESELFGHEKGAFTGAVAQRRGRFEVAADGTLFLDEISELPTHLQSKLLRVLQEKTFERVGGEKAIPLRARIIAASNRRLDDVDDPNPMRPDLYHRLNLVHLQLPELRERPEDIEALAMRFLAQANKELHKELAGIDEDALDRLIRHSWPGNVRELEHAIKRSALVATGAHLGLYDLLLDDVPIRQVQNAVSLEEVVSQSLTEIITNGAEASPFQAVIQRVEQTLVEQALKLSNGNQVAASSLLGINRTTLRKKLPH